MMALENMRNVTPPELIQAKLVTTLGLMKAFLKPCKSVLILNLADLFEYDFLKK